MSTRILVLDGAMGTAIQDLGLSAEDFGGEEYNGCNEVLVKTRPDAIRGIHRAYLEAGADCIETNTFGSASVVLAEYDLAPMAEELSFIAAQLAREEVDRASTAAHPRYVIGAMGPTTKTLCVTGGITFEQLRESYRIQARGLLRGGADVLLLETVQDTLNLKSGYLGILDAFADVGWKRPVGLSCTIEPMGTMLAGQSIEAFHASVKHIRPLFIGMNCATGPKFMTDHLRTLSAITPFAVSCYPNAGLPNDEGLYEETPASLAQDCRHFVDEGWVNLIGGCCGTTPAHIRALAAMAKGRAPRSITKKHHPMLAGIDSLSLERDNLPLQVGERTNVIGSRKFKELIAEGKYEQGAEVGRGQVRGGAHIVDVCMADPDRDELSDMKHFLPILTRLVKAPLMIDSTDAVVLEESLAMCQGKAIINSINLEDGEERFEKVVPLARRYGAALVVGCIDEDPEDGMAVTQARKLEIARRSFDLLTGKYGIEPEDIIFDPLVFPVGTGDEKYRTSGKETIAGVKLIAEEFPQCHTVLGISNVSFGLPPAGREVLNSVFLHHCLDAGLTMAIVNSQKLERFANIPANERELCDNLIFCRTADPIAEFTAFYRERKVKKGAQSSLLSLPLAERLPRNIVDGTKEGLRESLDEALAQYPTPLDIINGPLMAGMAEVGRLFNNNELIVAEVLQSAEVMKAAVGHLEPHMEKAETATRGKIVLATVKGDVHDIGKNLVQIILSNNGYDVIDLGIKVPPAALIEAILEHKPDALGLSGLLVKSAHQMVVTAEDLQSAGIKIPILVGGAALSAKFTASKIAPAIDSVVVYAKDAMNGLDIANQLLNPETTSSFVDTVRRDHERLRRGGSSKTSKAVAAHTVPSRSPEIHILDEVPATPDTHRHIEVGIDLKAVFDYINPQMLYCKHLGLRGNYWKRREEGDPKALELEGLMLALLEECRAKKLLHARALWQFFPVSVDAQDVVFHDPATGKPLETIRFPRQQTPPFQSITDLVKPGEPGRPSDSVALFVTTCGHGVRALAEEYKQQGEFLKSHMIQVLALETAEGLAEWVHERIRRAWGLADPPGTTPQDMMKARYRGKRYSFGYPACPDLSQQVKLWRLLRPDDSLGVDLTEGYMMDPEASVSALVFHHPQATYFGGVDGSED
ncbi:MAG: methionine synthase [Planctomycetota bacterium]